MVRSASYYGHCWHTLKCLSPNRFLSAGNDRSAYVWTIEEAADGQHRVRSSIDPVAMNRTEREACLTASSEANLCQGFNNLQLVHILYGLTPIRNTGERRSRRYLRMSLLMVQGKLRGICATVKI
jgi:hypothetical protein